MNLLFLTLSGINSIYKETGIYADLLREFAKHGHKLSIISPIEKKQGKKTYLVNEENATILRLQIGNTQKTNVIEKGISTVTLEYKFVAGIKKYFADIKFDLVLYSTPPITLVKAIEYVKQRDGAKTYLLLKDIFPQNAVDIGMLSKTGVKGLLYKYFRNKEKKLYALSDRIGCMSPANVEYVLQHNPEVKKRDDEQRKKYGKGIVEVCPNSIEVVDKSVDAEARVAIRKKYGIPLDKKVFVYGGNLGKPQDIPFLIKCLEKSKVIEEAFFLIVGDGTEYGLLEKYVNSANQQNLKLMKRLPKEDYDTMVAACDVGMIFLDHRFTIPNFPSRLLGYMQAKLPVMAVTDPNTDIGKIIVNGGFGWWCESEDEGAFVQVIRRIIFQDTSCLTTQSFSYLQKKFSCEKTYNTICETIE